MAERFRVLGTCPDILGELGRSCVFLEKLPTLCHNGMEKQFNVMSLCYVDVNLSETITFLEFKKKITEI